MRQSAGKRSEKAVYAKGRAALLNIARANQARVNQARINQDRVSQAAIVCPTPARLTPVARASSTLLLKTASCTRTRLEVESATCIKYSGPGCERATHRGAPKSLRAAVARQPSGVAALAGRDAGLGWKSPKTREHTAAENNDRNAQGASERRAKADVQKHYVSAIGGPLCGHSRGIERQSSWDPWSTDWVLCRPYNLPLS